jgi:hypothetical protein
MKFKVDMLPNQDDTCPFEHICSSCDTPDCPKSWVEGTERDPTERAYLRECEFLIEDGH